MALPFPRFTSKIAVATEKWTVAAVVDIICKIPFATHSSCVILSNYEYILLSQGCPQEKEIERWREDFGFDLLDRKSIVGRIWVQVSFL